MNPKANHIIEIIWLILAIICLVIGFHKTIQTGLSDSYMLFILAVISFVMYSVRHYIRKSQK